ncbi:MAG: alpha/beta hydrolase family protein [Ramlibacter sp.]
MRRTRASHPLWVSCALLLAVATPLPARAQDPVPIEAFFQNPAFSGAELSPTADYVSILVGSPTRRTRLVVIDTRTMEASIVANFADADVVAAHWINDHRLVFQLADLAAGERQDFDKRGGILAVDASGADLRMIPRVTFQSALRDMDDDRAIVLMPHFNYREDFDGWLPFVIDTRADNRGLAGLKIANRTPADTWLYDREDHLRFAQGVSEGRSYASVLDVGTGKWRAVGAALNGGEPLAIAPDGKLLVKQYARDGLAAVYRFDFATLAYEREPLLKVKGFDFDGSFVMDSKRLLGIRYRTDAAGAVWFDEKLAQAQRDVDAALPGRTNVLGVALRPVTPIVLVNSHSDRDPGAWLLFNTETKVLSKLGDAMPGIEPRRMGQRDLVRYKARDGLEIPAWLTLPAGAGKAPKLPLVVLVHGGPYVQAADWRWDPGPQFLASRGYAVLEPQFRGTKGFGWKHLEAGFKQWGLAMQDDLADGARWAIDSGIADPGRICIAGASYGGYASMMGLVRNPELFRCGINWLGVTDIELGYTAWFSDLGDEGRIALSRFVADRDKDAEQIKATSPLRLAAKITQPVLLAYGGADMRVPITHGRRFLGELERTNHDVEWVEYREEGHGWRIVRNRVDFWRRVENFLGRTIGPSARPGATAAARP